MSQKDGAHGDRGHGCRGICKCCGCAGNKGGSKRRRKIHTISQPLRPEELNLILSQQGLLNESVTFPMPSAWMGPFPKGHQAGNSTVPAGPSFQPTATTTRLDTSMPGLLRGDHPLRRAVGGGQVGLDQLSLPGQLATSTSPLAYSLSVELASVGKHRFRLTYITDRLLVVSYPPGSQEADHNEGARWLCQAFERRYNGNYRIFNLSGFTKELHLSCRTPVIDLFWPVPLAPGLEQLVTAIDQLDYWLHNHDVGAGIDNLASRADDRRLSASGNSNNQRVAVLHCTGPRSLLATYLAVYICQSKARFGPLCGQRPGSPTARGLQWNERRFYRFRNELVLGHMILKRFYEDNLARELIPSQKRYVSYFSGLVTGALILQDRLVHLHFVVYRNPGRRGAGRFLTPGLGATASGLLEPIAEGNNNNNNHQQHANQQLQPDSSVYAHPDEVWQHAQPPSPDLPMDAPLPLSGHEEWSPTEGPPSRHHSRGGSEWQRLASMRWEGENTGIMQPQQPVGERDSWGEQILEGDTSLQWHGQSPEEQAGGLALGGLMLKIYQNLRLMHTTRILCPNANLCVEKYIFPIEPVLALHGDILIACFSRPDISTTTTQDVVFRLQFHTCASNFEKMSFYKHDLDEACSDISFPPTGCIELYFASNTELLREHADNLDRSAYAWASGERESSILTGHHSQQRHLFQHDLRQHQQVVGRRSRPAPRDWLARMPSLQPNGCRTDADEVVDLSRQQLEKPLSVLVGTAAGQHQQDYPIVCSSLSAPIDGPGDYRTPMWAASGGDGGAYGRPGGYAPSHRAGLSRQASDPLSQPSFSMGYPVSPSTWHADASRIHGIPPPAVLPPTQLHHQQVAALLSPRVHLSSSGRPVMGPQASALVGLQSNLGLARLQTQINRLSLTQLQVLQQYLLQQQQENLIRQQQQQQQHQQRQLPQPLIGPEAGVYATVQRPGLGGTPSSTNLFTLLSSVQRAMLLQQQQAAAAVSPAYPQSVPLGQVKSGTTPSATQLLASLNTSTALTGLTQALVPSGLQPRPQQQQGFSSEPGLHRFALAQPGSSLHPSSLVGSLQPGGHSGGTALPSSGYLHSQRPWHQSGAAAVDPELDRLYLQLLTSRTSASLQDPIGSSTAALLQSDALGYGLGVPPSAEDDWSSRLSWADQRRRGEIQRTRQMLTEQERRLFDELRSIRHRRAGLSRPEFQTRIPLLASPHHHHSTAWQQDATPLEHYRRATGRMLTAVPGMDRGRGGRMLQAIGRSGSADAAPSSYGSRGGQYFGDHYFQEQSEDAALLALLEHRLARPDAGAAGLFSDTEGRVGAGCQQQPGSSDIPLKVVGPQQRSGHVVDGSSQAILSDSTPGDLDREVFYHSRQPRVHLDQSPGDVWETRIHPSRGRRMRAFSGSPLAYSPHQTHRGFSELPGSPSRRLRYWPSPGYEEQDQSPVASPVQTPSARLLRSPVSPPSRAPVSYARHTRHPFDTGSQSDTGLMDYPMKRRELGPWSTGYDHSSRRAQRPGRGMEHIPESALITLSRLSASTHVWYRPEISRGQSIDLVRGEPPGTFIVRNSSRVSRSFGLVLKVSGQPSQGGAQSSLEEMGDSVRHYLIEGLPSTSSSVLSQAIGVISSSLAPSTVPMGPSALSVTHGVVRLRGCSSEPVFTNLISLIYEHVLQPIALPCPLLLPFKSPTPVHNLPSLIALHASSGGVARDYNLYHHHHQAGSASDHREGSSSRGRSHHLHQHDSPRLTLSRHPSDPLPSGYLRRSTSRMPVPPAQLGLPPGQMSSTGYARHNGHSVRGRSFPPVELSAYETEFGQVVADGQSQIGGIIGRGRSFTAVYLGSIDTENLTGASAMKKAVDVLLDNAAQVKQTEVTIKVTHDGLTVTDNWRKLFFRRHYPYHSVSYCATDPQQRCWNSHELRSMGFKTSRSIFGFVARKQSTRENMCHVLCDTPSCDAANITGFITQRLSEY